MNKVILIGNVGKDPEIKRLESGKSVANLSFATNESYKDKQGNEVKNTEWHNLVVWSPIAEVFENHVKKGTSLAIEGKIKTRSYEHEGKTKYITEIEVRNFEFTGK